MPSFSPYAIINKVESTSEIKGHYIRFKRYSELKKSIIELINKSYDGEVHVLRSRRGKWGEWNEKWKLNHLGKPFIFEEGWS